MARVERDCPACLTWKTLISPVAEDVKRIDCDRCGSFTVTDEFLDDVDAHFSKFLVKDRGLPARISYSLHLKGRGRDFVPHLTIEDVDTIARVPYRPNLAEQADNLIRLVCDRAGEYGKAARIQPNIDLFRIGAVLPEAVGFVAAELINRRLMFDATVTPNLGPASTKPRDLLPTFEGWSHYDEIVRRGGAGSRAFLAMPFNRRDLDDAWLPKLREAVEQTGFQLRRVDDEPKPGIIDIRMRQEIRDARFVIVELTYSNLGAYWEAGFAEGLGKPVIYTCREGDEAHIHFDTAHLQRIVWSPSKLGRSLQQLIAMIRLTVPGAR